MDRINAIINNALYAESQEKIDALERYRIFCRHGIEHALDVSRITYIMALEKGLDISKEICYACGLLHDIGRSVDAQDHDKCSVDIAKIILRDCSYSQEEIAIVIDAIDDHRKPQKGGIAEVLYLADKQSRLCMHCAASRECKWDKSKKNSEIKY